MSKPSTQKAIPPAPVSLHQHAEDNLRFIRDAMESATSFTGVSGKGLVLAGISALVAAWLAAQQASAEMWLAVWMIELLLAASLALAMTAAKARSQGKSLWLANGRKLLLAFIPAMTVGGVLTLTCYLQDNITQLPGIWLSVYGAAVMTAGTWSVRVLPVMGALFMLLGTLVLLAPVPADLMLALGLGGLHIIFGLIVWRQHGG